MFIYVVLSYGSSSAQTIPYPVSAPTFEDFGSSAFSTLPMGFAAWNGAGNIASLNQAETSVPTGNALFLARTSVTPNNGIFGLELDSNARTYIQTSLDFQNGRSQLALSVKTIGLESITLSFDLKVESRPSNGRQYGIVAQYRVGKSGAWTTLGSMLFTYHAVGTIQTFTNLPLGADADNQTLVQFRWATWNMPTSGNVTSGGLSIDNISVNGLPSSAPVIDVDSMFLHNFNYAENSGPSALRSFNVEAYNMVGNGSVNIDSSMYYEFSTSPSGPFFNTISLPYSGGQLVNQPVQVFVRLAGGLSPGVYDETISISDSTSPTVFVYLRGFVVSNGLEISSLNTNFIIDFDSATQGSNGMSFAAVNPISTFGSLNGFLDNGGWSINIQGNPVLSPATYPGDFSTVFALGVRNYSPLRSIYAVPLSTNNHALGWTPSNDFMSTGFFTLRLKNTSGFSINELNVAFDLNYYNAQNISSHFKFYFSTDNVTYSEIPTLSLITPSEMDLFPNWEINNLQTYISKLNVVHGEYIYLRWASSSAAGFGGRDGFCLDNIVIRAFSASALNTNPLGDFESQSMLKAWVYNNEIYIQSAEDLGITRFEVTDMSGKVVYMTNAEIFKGHSQITLPANFSKGVYLLQIGTSVNYKVLKFMN